MTVTFVGHRNIKFTKELKDRLSQILEKLIIEENADTFLFGSRSEFNDLCYKIVTE